MTLRRLRRLRPKEEEEEEQDPAPAPAPVPERPGPAAVYRALAAAGGTLPRVRKVGGLAPPGGRLPVSPPHQYHQYLPVRAPEP